jgi:hypothetical protein
MPPTLAQSAGTVDNAPYRTGTLIVGVVGAAIGALGELLPMGDPAPGSSRLVAYLLAQPACEV